MKSIMFFLNSEDGAVTVDWVVLTAGVVVLGVGIALTVQPAVDSRLIDVAALIEQ